MGGGASTASPVATVASPGSPLFQENESLQHLDAHREIAEAICDELGYVRRRIPADGNCLFRCLAERILGEQDLHIRVRNEIVDEVSKDPERVAAFLEEDFETYASRMRLDATWGGELELRTAARLYSKFIVVYSAIYPPVFIGQLLESDNTLPLFYFHGNHYDLLYTVEEMNYMEEALGDLRGISPTGAARWRKKLEKQESEDLEYALQLQRGGTPPMSGGHVSPLAEVEAFLMRRPSVRQMQENGIIAPSDVEAIFGAIKAEKRRMSGRVGIATFHKADSIRSRCDSIDALLKKRPTINEMVVSGILRREDVKNSLKASDKLQIQV